jgi:hypothetical protein
MYLLGSCPKWPRAPPAGATMSDVWFRLGPDSLLQDEMLLAPFLTTGDLLRLSEAAWCLLPYRAQLQKLGIERWDVCATPAMLSQQRRLEEVTLRGPAYVVAFMKVRADGGLDGLQS